MSENDMQNPNELDKTEEASVEESAEQPEETAEMPESGEEQEPVFEAEAPEEAEEPVVKEKKHMKTGAVVAITAVATVAVCAIALFVYSKFFFNPYNANCKYMNTLKDSADNSSMTVDELKKELQLPSDMPDNTYLQVAQMYIPLSYFAKANGVDVATIVASYNMSDEYASKVTEDTTYGELNELYEKYMAENQTTPTPTPTPSGK